MMYTYPYPHPALTTDALLLRSAEDGRLEVLLIRRRHDPYAGLWALPGGFVDEGEAPEETVRRELEEETGLTDLPLQQLATFGRPGRDPRGWTVSVVFWAQTQAPLHPRAGDDAAEVAWWPLDDPPPLAFDHADILALARERIAQARSLAGRSAPFLAWLEQWLTHLPRRPLAELAPQRTAALAVDLVRGFCTVGPLASPRVQAIVPRVVALFDALYDHGVRHFLLSQDAHTAESPEFDAFAPHCLKGSEESETVPELLARPFAKHFTLFEKNSLSSTLGTGLIPWLEAHPQVDTFIIVGDCTDLCIYEAAMALRLRANAFNRPRVRVIVPADGVQTYDLPVETAQTLGILPHDGDLLHGIALYLMSLNGIEVVSSLS